MKLKDLTPEGYSCFGGLGCHSVYSTESGTLILVGKRLKPDDPRLEGLVKKAPDEEIIEISADLLKNLIPRG